MQLLVLKLIYLIFTTKGTSEYFYTNDLCVLVDVFLREVVDLDDDSESVSAMAPIELESSHLLPATPYIPARPAPSIDQDSTSRCPVQAATDQVFA